MQVRANEKPSIIVHLAKPGSPLSDGTKSTMGHMWMTVSDGKGNSSSMGFGPVEHGFQGAAQLIDHDDDMYVSPEWGSNQIYISGQQYDALMQFKEQVKKETESGQGKFSNYNGLNNNCIDFSWEGLTASGIVSKNEYLK